MRGSHISQYTADNHEERNLQLVDTSKFTDYIARITDNDAPTSNVFLLEGMIRSMVSISGEHRTEETEAGKKTLFEEEVLCGPAGKRNGTAASSKRRKALP